MSTQVIEVVEAGPILIDVVMPPALNVEIGTPGLQGAAGPQGLTGPVGPQGIKGDLGDSGVYDPALKAWHAALASRETKTANVIVWGASLAEGYGVGYADRTVAALLGKKLRVLHPTIAIGTQGGNGFFGVGSAARRAEGVGPQYFNGGTFSYTQGATHALWTGTPADSVAHYFTSSVTAVDVQILAGPAGSPTGVEFEIDNGSTQVFGNYAATEQVKTFRITVPTDAYKITLSAATGQTLRFSGITEFNQDETCGIQAHNLGHSGMSLTEWMANDNLTPNWLDSIVALDPSIIIIQDIGINDGLVGGEAKTVAQVKTALENIIAFFRTELPNVPFILAPSWNVEGLAPLAAPYEDYVAMVKEIADLDSDITFIDHSARMPAVDDAETFELYNAIDNIHGSFSGSGYNFMADTYAEFLSNLPGPAGEIGPAGPTGTTTINGHTGSVITLTKSDIGLGSVDNTSDADKPVSSAQLTALNAKAPLANPTFTGTVNGITKAMVGLSNVDNTSDTSKPISALTQDALNAKANVIHTHVAANITDFNAAVDARISVLTTGAPNLLNDFNELAAAMGDNPNFATDITTLIGTKENTLPTGNAAQYLRGDKTMQTLNKAAVGLSNVDNTSDVNKPISTAVQTALNLKANDSGLVHVTGNETIGGSKSFSVGDLHLSNVTNNILFFDATAGSAMAAPTVTTRSGGNKIVLIPTITGSQVDFAIGVESTALWNAVPTSAYGFKWYAGTTAIATLSGAGVLTAASYVGSGAALSGITKAQVGLSNVDNTSDASKPISTLTQAALDGKQPLITASNSTEYYRGDKTMQPLNKAAVGLANVVNVDTSNASNISSGTLAQARMVPNVVRVVHGSSAGTARPTGATYVEWVGSVEPTNAINNDTWVDTA